MVAKPAHRLRRHAVEFRRATLKAAVSRGARTIHSYLVAPGGRRAGPLTGSWVRARA